MIDSMDRRWLQQFNEGRENVNDNNSGWSPLINNDVIAALRRTDVSSYRSFSLNFCRFQVISARAYAYKKLKYVLTSKTRGLKDFQNTWTKKLPKNVSSVSTSQ
ncbi:hypothetical protein TNCV_3326831 [Trichonephila clavipes]|nr:hypothetical protein TNCV_3326831 [Trichonephila clavipes]